MTPLPQRTVLQVLEHLRPGVTGYSNRSVSLIEALERTGEVRARALVSSRQHDATGLPDWAELARPALLEPPMRTVRPHWIDGRALTRQISSAIGRTDARIVHVHWSSSIGAAALRAARLHGLPLVAEVRFDLAGAVASQSLRGAAPPLLIRALRHRFERHLRHADAIVAASNALASLIRLRLPDSDVIVVPNGRTVSGRQTTDASRSEDPEHFVVGSTSHMLRYEGLDRLVRAAAVLRDRGIPVRVRLAGGGPEQVPLQRLIDDLSAPVELLGRIPARPSPTSCTPSTPSRSPGGGATSRASRSHSR